MTKTTESKTNKTILRVILAVAVVLLFCGAAVGAAGADNPTNEVELRTAVENVTNFDVKLGEDIELTTGTLNITTSGTLDLNGYVLSRSSNAQGGFSVITVGYSDQYLQPSLTIKDSNPNTEHWFEYSGNVMSAWKLLADEPTVKTGDIKYTSLDAFDRKAADNAVVNSHKVYIKVLGGCITGGTGTEKGDDIQGGGVFMNYSADYQHAGALTLESGNIVGNSAKNGGGICTQGTATIFGNILGNYVEGDGGGIGQGGTVTLSGNAKIIGNTAGTNGGGVVVWYEFTMNGGSIFGNVAGGDGGGVYNKDSDRFKVSGTPIIRENTKGTGEEATVNNVALKTGTYITVTEALSPGAEIWIADPVNKGDVFAVAADEEIAAASYGYFHSDSEFYGAAQKSDAPTNLIWGTDLPLIEYRGEPFCGNSTADNYIIGGDGSPFNTTNAAYDPTSHVLTLKANLTDPGLFGSFKILAPKSSKPFTINLNENVLRGSDSVITVPTAAELVVTDNENPSQTHYFKYKNGNYSWEYVKSGSIAPDDAYKVFTFGGTGTDKFTRKAADAAAEAAALESKFVYIKVTGGCITGGKGTEGEGHLRYGGGVYVNGGTFTLSSGNIVGNSTEYGGGVCVTNNGLFTMFDGNIVGNFVGASGQGGGVCVTHEHPATTSGTFNLNGGNIVENIAQMDGGGVYVYTNGIFNVSGTPIIKDNMVGENANNVYLGDENRLKLTGDFTGEIYIHSPFVAGEQFGTADNVSRTGADNFISDHADNGGHYVGMKEEEATVLKWESAPGAFELTIPGDIPNGAITASSSIAKKDTTVTLTVTPDTGYQLKNDTLVVIYTGEDGTERTITPASTGTAGEYTFEMPDGTNINVTAEFEPVPTVTVTFDANGHGTTFTQTVEKGSPVARPTNPTASGYTFGGWFKEAACTNEYNFSTPVTANITLYANWTAQSRGGGSKSSGGSTIWLQETPTPTPTPTVTPTPDVQVQPISSQTGPAKTPVPFLGILAGLGAVTAVFGLRRK